MEMDIVLRTLLSHFELAAASDRGEGWRFRGVAFAPRKGGLVAVRRRATPITTAPGREAQPTAEPVAAA